MYVFFFSFVLLISYIIFLPPGPPRAGVGNLFIHLQPFVKLLLFCFSEAFICKLKEKHRNVFFFSRCFNVWNNKTQHFFLIFSLLWNLVLAVAASFLATVGAALEGGVDDLWERGSLGARD